MRLDVARFVAMLEALALGEAPLPVLRTYWYDGARDHIPTAAHLDVAALPHVKLRLGHLNSRNEQKGVDALIYRDLMTLARERAIADAYLLSGDEDLREGVRSAQDMGVRVTLVGITPKKQKHNQSRDLVHEADNVIVLDQSQLAPVFTAIPVQAAASLWTAAQQPVAPASVTDAESHGTGYAKSWLQRATVAEQQALIGGRPRIPSTLDADLLTSGRLAGLDTADDAVRRAVRRAFWKAVPASMPSGAAAPVGAGAQDPSTSAAT